MIYCLALGLRTIQYVERKVVFCVQMETEGEKGSGETQTIGQKATGEEAPETMATPLLVPGTTRMDLLLEIATSEGEGGSLIFHGRYASCDSDLCAQTFPLIQGTLLMCSN